MQEIFKNTKTFTVDGIYASLKNTFPKSNEAELSKMAQNINAMTTPYLLGSTDKADLQRSIQDLPW